MGQSGFVFIILGTTFIAVGLSGQRTFLWMGVPFLITGITTLIISRRETGRADADNSGQ